MIDKWAAFCAAIAIGIGFYGCTQCARQDIIRQGETEKACIDKGLNQYCQPIKK